VWHRGTAVADGLSQVRRFDCHGWHDQVGRHGLAQWHMYDATNAAPVKDRLLFDIFTTVFSTPTPPRDSFPSRRANNPRPGGGTRAWSGGFLQWHSSLPTNVVSSQPFGHPNPPERLHDSTLGALVQAIYNTRTNMVFCSPTKFHARRRHPCHAGIDGMGFSNWSASTNTFSDEMYEWLPQQTMSLLRVGSPRYVVYSYGQALKPAPRNRDERAVFAVGTGRNYQGRV